MIPGIDALRSRKNYKIQTRSWRHRLLRFFLWSTGAVLLLFILLIVAVRIFFPEDKVITLISDEVKKSTGMMLQVESVNWKLPVRLQIDGVRLSYPNESLEDQIPLLQLHQAALHFKILPLLKRRFHVQSISIDQPQVYLNPDKLMTFQELTTAQADSIQPKTQTSDSAAIHPLPVSFSLSSFTLSDFDCDVAFPDSSQLRSVSLTGLNVEVGELNVPSDLMNAPDAIRGHVHIYLEDSELIIRDRQQTYKAFPALEFRFVYGDDALWSLDGDIRVDAERPDPNTTIGLRVGVDGRGFGQAVRIRDTAFRIGKHQLLSIDGNVSELTPQMTFNSHIQGPLFPLTTIRDVAKAFLPPVVLEPLNQINFNGGIHLAQGSICGGLNQIDFNIKSILMDGQVNVKDTLLMDSVSYRVDLVGSVHATGIDSIAVKMAVRVGQTTLQINDSSIISIGPIQLEVDGSIDSTWVPRRGLVFGTIENLLNGRSELAIKLQSPKKKNGILQEVGFYGHFTIDSAQIKAIPNLPLGTEGLVRARVNIRGDDLFNARLNLDTDFTDGAFIAGAHQDTLPPYRLQFFFQVRSDDAYQVFTVEKGSLKLLSKSLLINEEKDEEIYNAFFTSQLAGQADLKTNRFSAEVTDLKIINQYLLPTLPASIRKQMEGITVGGAVSAALQAQGVMDAPDKALVQGRINLDDGLFHYALQELYTDSIQMQVNFGGNMDQMTADGHARIGSLSIPSMRKAPVLDADVIFSGTLFAQDSLRFVCDSLFVDDLGVHAAANFFMDQLSAKPEMRATAEVRFESDVWIEAVSQLDLAGLAEASVKMWSTDQGEKIHFSGIVNSDDLHLQQGKLLIVRGINSHIPFEAGFDVNRAEMIQYADYQPPVWTEYESRRTLYRKADSGFLRIDTVDVMGYHCSAVNMDLNIEKGFVEIPRFDLQALDGNVGGACWVRLGSGLPEQIAYEIHAQASRINSAALGNFKIKKKEEAELNASLEFKGKGVDIEKEMDLEGYFHITQIGPKFASELLRSLDPTGSDRNIRLTRRLLDMGYKPQLFSFDMRHGYVYPSLKLSQPWFTPLRIPGDLKYGRLPLKFFLENPELGAHK